MTISLLFFVMATVLNSLVSGVLTNTYHLFLDPNSGLTLHLLLREPENRLTIFITLLMFFITIILWLYPHFIREYLVIHEKALFGNSIDQMVMQF